MWLSQLLVGHRLIVILLLLFRRFRDYTSMLYTYIVPQYAAVEHWAKIEVPFDADELEGFRKRMKVPMPINCIGFV